jgi:hypothetical protein
MTSGLQGRCHRKPFDRSFTGPSARLSPGSPPDAGFRVYRTNRVAKSLRRAFPGSRGRWPTSTDGVTDLCGRGTAAGSSTGMATGPCVTVTSDATFSATKPRFLFEMWAVSYYG